MLAIVGNTIPGELFGVSVSETTRFALSLPNFVWAPPVKSYALDLLLVR